MKLLITNSASRAAASKSQVVTECLANETSANHHYQPVVHLVCKTKVMPQTLGTCARKGEIAVVIAFDMHRVVHITSMLGRVKLPFTSATTRYARKIGAQWWWEAA